MTETAESVINDALIELIAQEAEQGIDPFEFRRAVRVLNRMMTEYAAKGINLGYTVVTNPNDVITVPLGAISGMVYNLAVRLAPALDAVVTPALALSAKEGYKAMQHLGMNTTKMNYPSTLPIGSGNEYSSGSFRDDHFFPGCCEDIDTCCEGE